MYKKLAAIMGVLLILCSVTAMAQKEAGNQYCHCIEDRTDGHIQNAAEGAAGPGGEVGNGYRSSI